MLMPSIALAKDMEDLPDTMETEVIQVEEEIPAEKNNPEKGGNIRFVSENAQGRFEWLKFSYGGVHNKHFLFLY